MRGINVIIIIIINLGTFRTYLNSVVSWNFLNFALKSKLHEYRLGIS